MKATRNNKHRKSLRHDFSLTERKYDHVPKPNNRSWLSMVHEARVFYLVYATTKFRAVELDFVN